MSLPPLTASGTPSVLPPDLIRAYQEAVFGFVGWRIGIDGEKEVIEFTLGSYVEQLDAIAQITGCFSAALITAANPESVPLSDAENAARHAALVADVEARRFRAMPAHGRDAAGEWPPEESLLVLGAAFETACEIGRTHGQNAIVWSDETFMPRLVLLR